MFKSYSVLGIFTIPKTSEDKRSKIWSKELQKRTWNGAEGVGYQIGVLATKNILQRDRQKGTTRSSQERYTNDEIEVPGL
jgi:hypothetical protein